MTTAPQTPPSRAARLRLRHRLDVALRGADLLEQKLRILRAEHERLVESEAARAQLWHDRLREAETWLLRALVLGGESALRSAGFGTGPATVTIDEATTMGVRHPSGASCGQPDRSPTAAALRNTALVHAEAAYREAVQAAAAYAAARASARIIGAETSQTRQRVRALRRHLIPRLEGALTRVDLALEQSEHEGVVLRRWARLERRG